jgi:hypothetical protein
MLIRAIRTALVALLLTTLLTACSAADNKNLSGQAALDALSTVVDKSVTKFDAAGGTETLSTGKTQYAVIFDPAAPEGKQVVSANLTDNSVPAFVDIQTVSMHAMAGFVATLNPTSSEISLTKNVFTIQGTDMLVEIFVTDDLVYKSHIWSTAAKTKDPQILVTEYGISKSSRLLFDSAVETSPAQ